MVKFGTGRKAALGAALLALAAGLYGTLRAVGNGQGGACPASAAIAARLAPLARGEVAAFGVAAEPKPAPDLRFRDPSGQPTSLSAQRGRTLLVNLWATWCEPCKREMPALDRAEGELGGPSFAVLPIDADPRDGDKARRWWAENRIAHLPLNTDPDGLVFRVAREAGLGTGLPTTLLVGPDGCGIGQLSGWAEWASPDGLALLRASMPTR